MNWRVLKDKLINSKYHYFHTDNGVLLYGDCLEVMSKFPEKIFDAIITDPPYGTTACKWDVIIPFEDMWRELKRIRKDRTPIVLFGSEPFSSLLRLSNIKEYKYDWIWDKVKPSGFQVVKYRPMMRTENIIVFGKNKINYFPIMIKREKIKKSKCYTESKSNPLKYNDNRIRTYTHKYPVNIIQVSNANQKEKLHPTQKPVALLEYLVKTYTNEGDLVLDFTCGSGTTLVACERLNRRWIGIEISEEYCKIAKKRLTSMQQVLFYKE